MKKYYYEIWNEETDQIEFTTCDYKEAKRMEQTGKYYFLQKEMTP